MKKKLLGATLFALSLMAAPAFAQDRACPRNPLCDPFEGITLTESQRTRLNALTTPGKAEFKRQRESRDSIMRASRAEYLGQVKQILTPEQYVKYLENSYVNSPRHQFHHRNGQRMHGNREMPDRRIGKDRRMKAPNTAQPVKIDRQTPAGD